MTNIKILVIAVNIIYIVLKAIDIYKVIKIYTKYTKYDKNTCVALRAIKVKVSDNIFSIFIGISSIALVLSNFTWSFIIVAVIGMFIGLQIIKG